MSKAMKFATALAVALPLMGIATVGSAEARDRDNGRYESSDRYDRDNSRYDNDRRQRAWSPSRIREHMRQYFDNIGTPRRDGDYYYLSVSQNGGPQQEVRVNAYTGHSEYLRDVNRRDRRGNNWR